MQSDREQQEVGVLCGGGQNVTPRLSWQEDSRRLNFLPQREQQHSSVQHSPLYFILPGRNLANKHSMQSEQSDSFILFIMMGS